MYDVLGLAVHAELAEVLMYLLKFERMCHSQANTADHERLAAARIAGVVAAHG